MGSLIASQDYHDVLSRSELLPGPVSGFMALKQLLFMLMCAAPDDTKGQEGRGVQRWPSSLTGSNNRENWSCPSSTEALRRGSYLSPEQHKRADPAHRGMVEQVPRAW